MTTTQTTALTIADRVAAALQSHSAEQHLKTLAASTAGIVAVSNRAGRDECHAAAMVALKARTAIVNASKQARADATAFAKAVITEENRLVALIEPEECRLKALRDAYDAEQERIKAEAARREKDRVQAITAEIQTILNYPVAAATATIDECRRMHDALLCIEIDERFAEFRLQASNALEDSRDAVAKILAAKVEAAAEAARIKAEQESAAAKHAAEVAEFNRLKAEADAALRKEQEADRAARAERDRIEAIRRQAEEEKLAADRAALAEEHRKLEADRQKMLAEIEAQRQAVLSKEAAERAVKQAAEDAIAAKLAEERRAAAEAENAKRSRAAIRQQIYELLDGMDEAQLLRVVELIEGLRS